MAIKLRHAFLPIIAAAAIMSAGINQASAHAVAIGYTPGATAGSLNLWLGSYHFDNTGDGPSLEGSAELSSITLSYDTTTPFTVDDSGSSATPAGLISGTNLIFSSGYSLSSINSWEAAEVTGLAAGDYTFTYIADAGSSAHWATKPDLSNIVLTLTSSDTAGGGTDAGDPIPEPATLALLGFGMAATGIARKRGKK
jgi:hypothetical protein